MQESTTTGTGVGGLRIRSIKPEFWTSDDIAQHDWPTRLLFIGLWSYVDDNGVGRDNDKLIKADLFPLEDDPRETLATVSRGLQALSSKGQITRYTVDGKPFLYINTWSSHQRIDKPNKARYPLPTAENSTIRETVARPSRLSREIPAPGAGEQGSRGAGEELPCASAGADAARDDSLDRFEEFWDAYDKKTGKKAAVQKWRLAIKKRDVTPDLLIGAARTYVAGVKAEGKHPQFTKDPATWLNGEHWTDEIANVVQLGPDRPRRVGLAFVPTCPTCGAPPENVHDPECPDQSWRPNTEGIGL